MTTPPIAVFASGSGRSLENLAEAIARGELDARIALCIADRPGIGVLERCERLGIEAHVLEPKALGGMDAFAAEAFARCEAAGARLVVLAGFLRLLPLPPAWRGRVLNIHPSLLPAHGGQGMYGDRVHSAVLAAGDTESGCTVHLVDEQYDRGPILLQKRVPVLKGDTPQTLAARVFEAECAALPEAIAALLKR